LRRRLVEAPPISSTRSCAADASLDVTARLAASLDKTERLRDAPNGADLARSSNRLPCACNATLAAPRREGVRCALDWARRDSALPVTAETTATALARTVQPASERQSQDDEQIRRQPPRSKLQGRPDIADDPVAQHIVSSAGNKKVTLAKLIVAFCWGHPKNYFVHSKPGKGDALGNADHVGGHVALLL
jgi:hypothetical protein